MHSLVDKAIARIQMFRKNAGVTKFKLSRMVGLPETTVRKLDDPMWNPTRETIKAFEAIIPDDFMP